VGIPQPGHLNQTASTKTGAVHLWLRWG